MNNSNGNVKTIRWIDRTIILAVSMMTVLLLTACGGTKVYNNDKTIIFRDTIYNVSSVKQISSKSTAKLSNDSVINMKGANKKKVQGLIKENGSIYVRMSFSLDEQEMLYRAKSVDNWNVYNSMQKDFEKAGKQITSLLGNKKQVQLKLR